jgi:hypothetical protein
MAQPNAAKKYPQVMPGTKNVNMSTETHPKAVEQTYALPDGAAPVKAGAHVRKAASAPDPKGGDS